MKKTLKTLIVTLIFATTFISTIVANANANKLEPVWSEVLMRLDITIMNDIVYSNCPNGVPVYESQNENSEAIGNIPFLWGIDRITQIGDNWSMISFNCKDSYIKTSDVLLSKEYDIREQNYDTVTACPEGVNVYSMPNDNDNFWIGNISSGTEISRIYTLTNGWTMISYDCKNAFVKTNSLVQKVYLGNYTITYYCPCSICNGPYGAVDRYGNPLVDGVAAVDPSVIPMGSTFYIQESYGLRTCVAKDVGGAINGNHIDVFVNVPHNVCENMGNTAKPVYIFKRCE